MSAAPSLRRTLLWRLTLGLVLALGAGAAMLYASAREQADALADHQLRQLASALPSVAFAPLAPGSPAILDVDEDVVIRIWDISGELLYASQGPSVLPPRAHLGFADVQAEGGAWRTYGAQLGDTVVEVAQPQAGRRRLAARLAWRTLAPVLLVLPLLALAVWAAVGRALAPVRRLAADVGERDAGALSPLSLDGLPAEIRPLGAALNDLLRRLDGALDAQRTFVADAAHELRTPLTALGLQAQLAERAADDAARRQAFADLRAGLSRATRLVQQLLTLARQEQGAETPEPVPLDLAEIAGQAMRELAPLAEREGASVEGRLPEPGPTIVGDRDALRILAVNLLDNALRHGRAGAQGARVEIGVDTASADGTAPIARLWVRDHGAGIPAGERSRVFDRFYRVPGGSASGSGLGLAIVGRVAARHGAALRLEDARPGLRVVVEFPDRLPVSVAQGSGTMAGDRRSR